MRQIRRLRPNSHRPGLKMSAVCIFLAITTPAAVLRAQPEGAAVGAATTVPPAPPDPWTSRGGVVSADADGSSAQAPGGGLIQVDLKADTAGVRLDRVLPAGNTSTVCFAPCTKLVRHDHLYVIEGEGIRATSQFVMPDDRNQVTLNVRAGSSARAGGGAALILGGIVLGYVGEVFAFAALTDGSPAPRSDNVATAGGVMVLVGLAALVGGIYMVLSSKTQVTSSTGSTFTQGERSRPRGASSVALTPAGLTF